jgi:hypothetical protein
MFYWVHVIAAAVGKAELLTTNHPIIRISLRRSNVCLNLIASGYNQQFAVEYIEPIYRFYGDLPTKKYGFSIANGSIARG